MDYNFKDAIEKLLEEKRRTKKSLYDHLKMTGQGFDSMLKNNTVSAVKLAQIAEFLDVPVSYFYDSSISYTVRESKQDTFGDQVIQKLAEDIRELRQSFEEEIKEKNLEIREKNQQIAGLQRMLEAVLGKSEGAAEIPQSDEEVKFAQLVTDYSVSTMNKVFDLNIKPVKVLPGRIVGGTPLTHVVNSVTVK